MRKLSCNIQLLPAGKKINNTQDGYLLTEPTEKIPEKEIMYDTLLYWHTKSCI
jgi:hypothetical protein